MIYLHTEWYMQESDKIQLLDFPYSIYSFKSTIATLCQTNFAYQPNFIWKVCMVSIEINYYSWLQHHISFHP